MYNKAHARENSLKASFNVSVMIALMLISLGNTAMAQGDTTRKEEIKDLLFRFAALKTAIMAGDAVQTSKQSEEFIYTLNRIDYKLISEGNIHILLKDATIISESGSAGNEEKAFANLSNNIGILARSFNLSDNLR